MEKKDGGSAFPDVEKKPIYRSGYKTDDFEEIRVPGMTLRCYIATVVYAQIVGKFNGSGDALADAKDECSRLAVEMADSLIAELAK
jgi:hypothetical protein